MIRSLHIQNYALIERLELDFSEGLQVLTGETGAGKSIIIGAISLLLGGRSQAEFIRDGEKRAVVEGFFEIAPGNPALDLLQEMELPLEEQEYLVLRRELNPNGKTVARINGITVPVTFLKEFASRLVNIYGQHDFQLLSDSSRHLAMLDSFAGKPVAELKPRLVAAWEAWETARHRERELQDTVVHQENRKELLKFQLGELETLALGNPLEDEEIDRELRILDNQEKINQLIVTATEALYGQQSAYQKVGAALEAARTLSTYVEGLAGIPARLENVYYELEDMVMELGRNTLEGEFDPRRLDALNDRKFQLSRYKKKYGTDLPGLIALQGQLAEELDVFENLQDHLEKAAGKSRAAEAAYQQLAMELSQLRKAASTAMEKAICGELSYLGMEKTIFATRFTQGNPGRNGNDQVEFLISANPGESPKPIAKIASGGEMSRIMLAMKVILMEEEVSTMIFDEIDSGIGGETMTKVAAKLSQLADNRQVLCVTHAAQVAGKARSHYKIRKEVSEERTFTRVEALEREERLEELARMLGDKGEAGREFARKMLS